MKEHEQLLSPDRISFLVTSAHIDARYRQVPVGRRNSRQPRDHIQYIQYVREDEHIHVRPLNVVYRSDQYYPKEDFQDERPYWLRRIAVSMLAIQEQQIDRKSSSIVDQMTDPLSMMGSSLRFTSEKDVEVWALFRESLIGITWPQTSRLSVQEVAQQQAETFTREIDAWLELGITHDTINKWFQCVESILSVPGLHARYLSQQGYFGEPMLADKIPNLHRKKNISKLYDHAQPYRRIDWFAQEVTALTDGSISDSAARVATITESLIAHNFPHPIVEIPTSYQSLMMLVTNALERSLSRQEKDYDKIAKKIIRFLRRNHVSFGYDEVVRMCASYCDKELGNREDTAFGEGLVLLNAIAPGAQEKYGSTIREEIVPRLLANIHKQGLLKNEPPEKLEKLARFTISIGLTEEQHPELYNTPEQYNFAHYLSKHGIKTPRLKDKIAYVQYCQQNGGSLTQIGPSDMVIKVSMTGKPPTYAHSELLYDLLEVTEDPVWVLIEPNNNPGKTHTHDTLIDRWISVHDSFCDVPGVLMMPLLIQNRHVAMSNSGPTFVRLEADRQMLLSQGHTGQIHRGCGIEKLDPAHNWTYGPSERSSDLGNKWPHVFLGDRVVMDHWPHAPEIIRSVLQRFPDTIVSISPVLNHGTQIRNAVMGNPHLKSIYLA